MPRHRRDPDACAVGDVIDGWRVEAYEPDRLLRLAAGLKLPGRGWLEFRVDAARRRSAIAHPPDGDFRPERRGGPTLLVRRAAAPRAHLPRSAAADRAACRAARRARAPVDLHLLLDHRRASGRGVPLARAAGSARGADSRGAGANRRAGGRHPRRRARHAVGRHRSGACPLGGAASRLHTPAGDSATSRYAGRSPSGGTRICSSRSALRRRSTRIASSSRSPAAARSNRFAAAVLRPVLTLAFAHRHRIVRASVGRARRPGRAPMGDAAVALAAAATLQTTAAARADRRAGSHGSVRRSGSICGRLVRDRAVSQSVSAPVRRRRARQLRPPRRRPARRRQPMPHRRWPDPGARDRTGRRRAHVRPAEGAVRAGLAVVAAVRLGRLLDHRPRGGLFVGGRRDRRTASTCGSSLARRASTRSAPRRRAASRARTDSMSSV